MINRFLPVFKGSLSLGLAVFFLFLIHSEWQKLAPRIAWQDVPGFFRIDPENVKNRAHTTTINELIPDYIDLLNMNSDPNKFSGDPEKIIPYIKYYKKLTQYSPQMPEPYLILGFCYFYQHQERKAEEAFLKTVGLNPSIFWAQYNLGVMYFKKQDFKNAAKFLSAAVLLKPEESLKQQMSSKVFQQILFGLDQTQLSAMIHLQGAYKNSLVLLSQMQSLWQNKKIPKELTEAAKNLSLYIF